MTPPTLLALIFGALCLLLIILLFRFRQSGGDRTDSPELLRQMSLKMEQIDRMARQMEEMNRIFNNPRMRGGLGETLMEELIRNWLPSESYRFQYGFSNGQRADAVILMGSYKVAVDAKFSLEQIRSMMDASADQLPPQIRKVFLQHGKSIAEKYILPREGTLPFALMYIPSEGMYYRAFIQDGGSLMNDLLKMGILPVSPSNLFVYLQTVVYGFRGFSFSNRSRELMTLVAQVRQDYDTLIRQFSLAGTHLKNFQKSWEETSSRLDRMDRTIRAMDGPEKER
jgi:DNA recombination protein RmuC